MKQWASCASSSYNSCSASWTAHTRAFPPLHTHTHTHTTNPLPPPAVLRRNSGPHAPAAPAAVHLHEPHAPEPRSSGRGGVRAARQHGRVVHGPVVVDDGHKLPQVSCSGDCAVRDGADHAPSKGGSGICVRAAWVGIGAHASARGGRWWLITAAAAAGIIHYLTAGRHSRGRRRGRLQ